MSLLSIDHRKVFLNARPMLSIFLSTIAFFVASYLIKRYLDDNDIPKGMTRSIFIFCLAALISYGVAIAVDYFDHPPESAHFSKKTTG